MQIADTKMRTPAARSSLVLPAGMAAITLTCLYASLTCWYLGYRIYGDDLSVLSASAGSPRDWFVKGFSYYFRVYPEWGSPLTDFLRPGVNAVVRAEQLLFGNHYLFYFLVLYVVQILMIWCLLAMARDLGVGERYQAILAVLLSIEPAFVDRGLMNIAYQEDVWCGFFTIVSLFLLTRRRYVLALLVLIVAVFTKEAAVFAPVAAALTVAYETRRRLLAVSMLLPLVIYFFVRELIFVQTGASSVRVLLLPEMTFRSIGFYVLRGVLFWPIGSLGNGADIAFYIAGSIAFWALLAVTGRLLFSVHDGQPFSAFSVLIWLLGAVFVGVLVAQQSRLGGSIFPLELLFLAVLVSTTMVPRRSKILAFSLFFVVALSYCLNLIRFHRSFAAEQYEQLTVQRLLDDLKSNSRNAATTYILNSAPNFTAPEYLARAADLQGRVVVLNQFDGCLSSDEGSTAFQNLDEFSVAIVVRIPRCARFVFKTLEKSNFDPPLNGLTTRGDFAKYSFADQKPSWRHPWDPRFHIPDLGQEMTIILNFDSKTSILLYYDWQSGKYRCFGRTCGAT